MSHSSTVQEACSALAFSTMAHKSTSYQVAAPDLLVRNRCGSVLCRDSILKSDHFETGLSPLLDIHLQGATNFRAGAYNVHGVAQPTTGGITTVLTLLHSHPEGRESSCWFSAREVYFLNEGTHDLSESQAIRDPNI